MTQHVGYSNSITVTFDAWVSACRKSRGVLHKDGTITEIKLLAGRRWMSMWHIRRRKDVGHASAESRAFSRSKHYVLSDKST